MKHLRWIACLVILMISTQAAKELHGWPGFWGVSVVLCGYGVIMFIDGYCARQSELADKLNKLQEMARHARR